LAFATFLVWRLRTGGYGLALAALALAALALVVFGAIECSPIKRFFYKKHGSCHYVGVSDCNIPLDDFCSERKSLFKTKNYFLEWKLVPKWCNGIDSC